MLQYETSTRKIHSWIMLKLRHIVVCESRAYSLSLAQLFHAEEPK